MEISEVRVKLVNNSQERLKAFCSITLENDFVIRDLKVIEGTNGTFVAMPSRKLSDRCPGCSYKNHLRAHYCNECGKALDDARSDRAAKRSKLHADIAHPINAACRERVQDIVIKAFEEELKVSKQPGYQPPDFDYGDETPDDDAKPAEQAAARPARSDHRADAPAHRPADPPADRQPDRPRDQHVDRPKADQSDRPAKQETGGYDELIAELKSDAEARRKGQQPRERQRQRDTFEPISPSESTHRDENPPAARETEPEDSGVDVASESAVEPPAPAPAPAPRSEPKQPPAPQPTAPKAPEPADDDFGAGIL